MTHTFIEGIHHLTATVGDAQEDLDFYTKLLGLRLVKQTVNFDNNKVFHFYYGNESGTPGTIMTTFPYKGQGVRQGTIGTGMVSVTGFSAPADAIPFWSRRLEAAGVAVEEIIRFGNSTLRFQDPSGLVLEIVGNNEDERTPWITRNINEAVAIRGFFTVVLSVAEATSSFQFLTDVFGFEKIGTEWNVTRFAVHGGGPGRYIDVAQDTNQEVGKNGIGTVHHVAWRIANDERLAQIRQRLAVELGFKVTEIIDRKYFHSIYFRMPGGVLFEIATIPPGFTEDESVAELGQYLQLPEWEEPSRNLIESGLPKIIR